MSASITIDRLGHRGDGVAPGPVYAPRTLPGEVVTGEVLGDRISEPKILRPSPDRVKAPCRHYGSCGGCAVQHASDAFVAGWKEDVIREALRAQGLDAPLRPIVTSPPNSRRRAVFSGRRLKSGPVVGFHARASDTLREVPDCHVLDVRVIDTLPALRELTAFLASRKGELTLTVIASDTGPDVSVDGGKVPDRASLEAVLAIARSYDIARLSVNGEVVAARRAPELTFGRTRVVPPPAAFLQATRHGEQCLQAAVAEALGKCRRAADLFAGCGTFALDLAARAEVHAVEGDAGLLTALDLGWRHGEKLRRVTTETRDLFRRPLLAEELSRFDAVVIDPPRAGAEAQSLEIASSTIRRVAAVSCNPATFARDARILVAAGFRLDWVQPVDQFRWSTHLELAACLTRDHMADRQGRRQNDPAR